MRVIAGTARSLPLKTIEGLETRPTTDRVKETLFNLLNFKVAGAHFLDLFAGSGGIGIEALSRGATHAVFVEKNPKALKCIRDNLAFTHLDGKAEVMGCDVLSAISRLKGQKEVFDVIFMDPPYNMEWEKKVLEAMRDAAFLDENTWIIVEASLDTDFAYVQELGYDILREKRYKTNKHVFLSRLP